MALRLSAALFLVVLGTACTESADSPATSSAPASPAAAVDVDRQLALETPKDPSSAIDRMLLDLAPRAAKETRKVDPWIALGKAWVRKACESSDPGFYLNARAAANVALRIAPGEKNPLNLVSLVLLNDHKFAEARASAERILTDDADDAPALGTLSDACLELGDFDAAAAAADKMMGLKPNLPSYSRASYLRWLQGDRMGAKKIVRLALDAGRDVRDPEPYAWTLVQAAMIFFGEGDYEGAEKGFDDALALVPGYPPALVGKGRAALTRNDFAAAADLFRRAHQASPLVETEWLLGDALALSGDAAGADAAYRQVVTDGKKGDPTTLVRFYAAKDRDHDDALQLVENEQKSRGGVFIDDAHGWALFRAGRIDDADIAMRAATRLGTEDARLLYHSGAVAIAKGDVERGRGLVARALALSPRFDAFEADEARKLLDGTSASNTPASVTKSAR